MKKITFKNEPSVETPLSAENLNAIQNNVEEEINKVDAVIKEEINKVDAIDKRLSIVETNKIDIEEYSDTNVRTIQAQKWGTIKVDYKKKVTNKVISEFNSSKEFVIKENGLYYLSFLSCFGYAHITGIYLKVNGAEVEKYHVNGGEKELVYNKVLKLKAEDKFTIEVYTDEANTFAHKFSKVCIAKIGN